MAMAMRVTTTANTAATMSTRQGPSSPLLKWGVVVFALLVGSALLFLAVPRVAAHAALLSAGSAVRALDEGRAVARAELEAAYAAYDEALGRLPHDAGIRRDRARLARRLAMTAPENKAPDSEDAAHARFSWQKSAVDDLRLAAAASPGDGVIWALLADAEARTGAPSETIFSHLRLARLTAPRRASVLMIEHGIVMRHWDEAPEEVRVHALSELPVLWAKGGLRSALIDSYVDAGFSARIAFRERLGENPRALQIFDRLLSLRLGI